jgi:hypothetical protein
VHITGAVQYPACKPADTRNQCGTWRSIRLCCPPSGSCLKCSPRLRLDLPGSMTAICNRPATPGVPLQRHRMQAHPTMMQFTVYFAHEQRNTTIRWTCSWQAPIRCPLQFTIIFTSNHRPGQTKQNQGKDNPTHNRGSTWIDVRKECQKIKQKHKGYVFVREWAEAHTMPRWDSENSGASLCLEKLKMAWMICHNLIFNS